MDERLVVLLQEVGAVDDSVRNLAGYFEDGVQDAAVLLPERLASRVRRTWRRPRAVLVQVEDTCFGSAHLPCVTGGEEAQLEMKAILADLETKIQAWRHEEHPCMHVVMGIDANAQVQAAVQGTTGDVVHSRRGGVSRAHRIHSQQFM